MSTHDQATDHAAEPAHPTEPLPRGAPADDATTRLLTEIRDQLDSQRRWHEHQEFSPARLIGGFLQVVVVPLVLWAASDWVFGYAYNEIFTKLGFALVLQLMALSAFVLSRRET